MKGVAAFCQVHFVQRTLYKLIQPHSNERTVQIKLDMISL